MMRRTLASPIPQPGNSERRVQPLEGTEEVVRVGRFEAHPVVPHRIHRLSVLARVGPHLDVRSRRAPGEFPRIADQVVQHQLRQARIAVGGHTGLDRDIGLARGRFLAAPACGQLRHRRQVHGFPAQLGARELGEREQGIDHPGRAHSAVAHAVHVMPRALAGVGTAIRSPVRGRTRRWRRAAPADRAPPNTKKPAVPHWPSRAAPCAG